MADPSRETHGTQVVVVVLDQHPPATVEAEVPDRVELAVVVGGHHHAVVARGPARDEVVGVLVGVGQRTRGPCGPASETMVPCGTRLSVVTATDDSSWETEVSTT